MRACQVQVNYWCPTEACWQILHFAILIQDGCTLGCFGCLTLMDFIIGIQTRIWIYLEMLLNWGRHLRIQSPKKKLTNIINQGINSGKVYFYTHSIFSTRLWPHCGEAIGVGSVSEAEPCLHYKIRTRVRYRLASTYWFQLSSDVGIHWKVQVVEEDEAQILFTRERGRIAHRSMCTCRVQWKAEIEKSA